MKFLLDKDKYLNCNNHIIQPTGENIENGRVVFGCLNCGVRYDNEEEIKNDVLIFKNKGGKYMEDQNKSSISNNCPNCGSKEVIVQLHCPRCDLELYRCKKCNRVFETTYY